MKDKFLAEELGYDPYEPSPYSEDEFITEKEKEIIKIILFQKDNLSFEEFHDSLSKYSIDELLNALDFIERIPND